MAKLEIQRIPVTIALTDAGDDKLQQIQALVYGRNGELLGQTLLQVGRDGTSLVAKGEIALPADIAGQSVRVTVAPLLDAADSKAAAPGRTKLERQFGAYTEPLRLDRRQPVIAINIARPYWQIWPRLCFCWVRGRLVKRVTLPNGTTLDLPICNARVTLCEVDRWPIWLSRLPDREILRLRDDLIARIKQPIPIPDPIPDPFPGPIAGLARTAPLPRLAASATAAAPASVATNVTARITARATSLEPTSIGEVRRIERAPIAVIRQSLIADVAFWRPWLCWIDWLHPWFVTSKYCFATVNTDEDGRFSALYVHACDGDQPDIYVSAEQLLGGLWTSIYHPSIGCGTHWNYACGSELTILVTDPRAQPCIPEPPVTPPAGVERWVLPHAIGGTFIGGTAGTSIPAGWVRPDGLTNYGGFLNAPFGGLLGFRQQHALGIPDASAYYYRWSWRRGGVGDFSPMTEPVSRNYVRDVPGPGLSLPTVQLGPTLGDRFRFRPPVFNPADWGVDVSTDPAGTLYYWPLDGAIGDIYSARWLSPGSNDALGAPGLADRYQVKLEVFNQANALVAPGAGSFLFLLPTSVDPDGTIHTREAQGSEIDLGGLVFDVIIDNSRCTGTIAPPVLSAGTADDDCGFLRYAPGAEVTLAFTAAHPHDRAVFGFGVVRGINAVAAAGAGGEVAASAPPYTLAGGSYSHGFAVTTLLETCPSAAFAADLHVYAKATDGSRQLWEYDAGQLRAFALAEGG